MNPITMLKNDHQKVDRLFQEHERAGSDGKKAIFDRIHDELTLHAELEEQVFYPAVREASTKGRETVKEGYEEHAEVKALLAELSAMDAGDDDYEGKIAELRTGVEHHVEEEEGEMLPEAERALGPERLEQVGARMQQLRTSLLGGGTAGATTGRGKTGGTGSSTATGGAAGAPRAGGGRKTAGSRGRSAPAGRARATASRSRAASSRGGARRKSTGGRGRAAGASRTGAGRGRKTAGRGRPAGGRKTAARKTVGRGGARKTGGRKTGGRSAAGRGRTGGRVGARGGRGRSRSRGSRR